jgi:4-amino-4-deoxy-L-arabinose transferase-like glycosyltransferase
MMKRLFYILGAICLYFLVFHKLDAAVVYLWDESRLAKNAIEMMGNGNWLVAHFDGKPDLWNTKPPLAIWLQALSMHALGINELALRLPTALAVLGTVLFLYQLPRFAAKTEEIATAHKVFLGFAIGLILLSSQGYMGDHGSRTCDYEGILILFTVLAYFQFFLYTEKSQSKHLCYAFAFLGLGVLTKSVQVLIPAPFILLWFISQRKLTVVLKDKYLYLGILLFLMLGPSFYLLREWAAPGYLDAAWNNDMGGRYATVIEDHTSSNDFYFNLLFGSHFMPWAVLAAVFPLLMFRYPFAQWKRLGWFSLGIGVIYQLIVAFSKTKTGWYANPSYPFFAVVAALSLHAIFVHLTARSKVLNVAKLIAFGALTLLPMTILQVVQLNKRPNQENGDFGLSKLSQEIYRGGYLPDQKEFHFCAQGYQPHLEFYQKALAQKNAHIGFVETGSLQENHIVYACN